MSSGALYEDDALRDRGGLLYRGGGGCEDRKPKTDMRFGASPLLYRTCSGSWERRKGSFERVGVRKRCDGVAVPLGEGEEYEDGLVLCGVEGGEDIMLYVWSLRGVELMEY